MNDEGTPVVPLEAVHTVAHRESRKLRPIDWMNIVAYGTLLLFIYLYYKEVGDRRQSVNSAVCSIVNAIPSGNERIDATRKRFDCGQYVPPPITPPVHVIPSSGSTSPAHSSPAVRSPSSSRGGNAAGPKPSANPTSTDVNVVRTSGSTRPVARTSMATTRTRSQRPEPRPTGRTVTRSSTATRTATRTATATKTVQPSKPTAILPLPGCSISILGIQVC